VVCEDVSLDAFDESILFLYHNVALTYNFWRAAYGT
jgi:hypothetical protein